jgi:galactokinase/mevalonate kinase-like predicted kinase
MHEYPHASVSPILIPNATWWELERRLVLIYMGKSHRSTEIPELVIKALEHAGPDCQQLEDLRGTAGRSMIREIEQENPGFKNIPIYLSRYGVRVWMQDIDCI